ncbi:MAG: pseudouridine synthase [Opitutales bacterium]
MDTDDANAAVRLQKFLSEAGKCSRRQGEAWIAEGRVDVNGETAHLGQKIDPEHDKVYVDGRRVQYAPQKLETIVLAMNKPRGVLCTNADPHGGQTVFDLVPPEWMGGRLFCAGRLDKDSEGLVILTNNGELNQRLTHPSNGVIKRYRVRIHRTFEPEDIPKMLRGVTREGERLSARKVIPSPGNNEEARHRLEIHLNQGRKREIRRLLEAFGYLVERLERVQIGRFELKRLPRGAVRPLSQKEVGLLLVN